MGERHTQISAETGVRMVPSSIYTITLTCHEPSQFNQFPCFSIPAALINLRTSLCTSLHLPLTDAVLHLSCWCDMKSLRPNCHSFHFLSLSQLGLGFNECFLADHFLPGIISTLAECTISSLLSCNIRCCHTFATLNSSVMDFRGL